MSCRKDDTLPLYTSLRRSLSGISFIFTLVITGNDYIVVGHEDYEANRLVVNMESVVKRWNRRKHRNRIINRIRRSRCR